MQPTEKDATRLWKRVAKRTKPRPGMDTPCWEWRGKVNDKGYGRLEVGGKKVFAHRLSYTLAVGAVPPGLVLLHRCDNRRCVRPDHLTPGTHLENMADMCAKGRQASKLSPAQAAEVKRRLAAGDFATDLAREFGVTFSAIRFIKEGRTWKEVATNGVA